MPTPKLYRLVQLVQNFEAAVRTAKRGNQAFGIGIM